MFPTSAANPEGYPGIPPRAELLTATGHLGPDQGSADPPTVLQGGLGAPIMIADPHLLFLGHFDRAGSDLVLTRGGHRTVVRGYFDGDERPSLLSAAGGVLSGK